jgi:hypothetical protein
MVRPCSCPASAKLACHRPNMPKGRTVATEWQRLDATIKAIRMVLSPLPRHAHRRRSLYVSLKARYNTRLQNGVYTSARMGAEELGSSKDYVARWHHELQHYGFIRVIEGKRPAWGQTVKGWLPTFG